MRLFILLLLNLSFSAKSEEKPRLKINDGRIEGTVLKSLEGREFLAFRGIPFAEPPLGPLRFKAPVPKKPWKKLLDATKPHNICTQKNLFNKVKVANGTEDCLFLNVYTPSLPVNNGELLPVMVFFHGGGFVFGSGDYTSYGPEFFLDHDIVLVIGNYRLGPLGFLSTGDEVSPGNYGLKDQSLVLKWVSKNIEHFGGDPKSVTLFGESAGGASTNFHMFSQLSKGLFKGVISQSGSVFNIWSFDHGGENVKNGKILAESVNCPTSPNKDLVECLQHIDALVLVDQDTKFMELGREPLIPFKPVVEPKSDEAFLTDTPYNLLQAGKFEDVPWIIGVTQDEGFLKSFDFLDNSSLVDDFNKDFNNKLAISMNYEKIAKDIDVIGEKIKKFYFGDGKIEAEKSFSSLTDMYSDAWFVSGIDEAIRNFRKVSNEPVFTYMFDHDGPLSTTMILGYSKKFIGSCHGDDLLYQFPGSSFFDPYLNITGNDRTFTYDRTFIKLFTTLWTNFARTGNPTPEENSVTKAKWKPVESDKLEHFFISPKVHEMRDALLEDRVNFWKSLPIKTRKDIESVGKEKVEL